MDLEARNNSSSPPSRRKTTMRRLLMALNCVLLGVGVTGGQLLSRLYYSHGGNRQWLSAWLQTAGWPLLLIPLAGSYAARRARDRGAPVLLAPPRVLLAAAGLGLITGADDYLYASGLKSLPVSTSAILISTQLVFTVLFALLIVGQRLTAAAVNAVALLTVGAVVLGLHGVSSDRPAGVTGGQYWLGFALTLAAAVLYGVFMPLVELAYRCAASGGRALTYAVAVELQLVIGFVATAFCTVGMVVNKDFQALNAREGPHHCAISTTRRDRTKRHGSALLTAHRLTSDVDCHSIPTAARTLPVKSYQQSTGAEVTRAQSRLDRCISLRAKSQASSLLILFYRTPFW